MKQKIKDLLLEKRRYDLKEKVNLIEKIKLFFDMPIQKIIGYVEMANVKIYVKKKVLIPRYETEELIYEAINFIKEHNFKNILDLGCGSGVIGIALKKHNNQLEITQVDIDKNAIKQTKKNFKTNKLSNNLYYSDMFLQIPKEQKFDLIISNPPYLLYSEKDKISKSVLNFEPHHALFAKNNGLEFYEIIEKNLDFLKPNGMVLFEINPINAKWFKDREYTIIKDINQKERIAFKFKK